MPIFIRCPGHLWDDDKFGQIGVRCDLAEWCGHRGRERAEIRLPPWNRRREDLTMLPMDTILPLTAATVLPVRGQQQPGRHRRPDPARP
ncbi:hypothetical protein ACFWIO_00080 [Streptomyces diastatochromogenes]|uniref:hypothetical protein n=1 Tax=Streptomyces diastatochromogenes TaxID=42236 RepID=UPI00364AE642